MRVLFTTSNWAGHYFCMIPLGWALQAAGHEVRVACLPTQTDTISSAGLVPVPVMDGPDMMYTARLSLYARYRGKEIDLPSLPLHPATGERVGHIDEFDVEEAQARFLPAYNETVRRSWEAVRRLARAWRPDLVCHDVLAEEGALAARELGVPGVFCAPGLFGTVDEELDLDLSTRDLLNSAARDTTEPWNREDIEHVVDPSPPSAVPPLNGADRIPMQYVPYNGPGAMPLWTLESAGRPRICVVWGRSATGIFGPEVPALRAAVVAAAEHGAEVVVTASAEQVAALGELPARVRTLCDFPLHLLLEASDAVIHHGSDNCLMNAALAGVPQLALAMAGDQVVFSRRLAATGAVVALRGLTAEPEQVRTAVSHLLDERYRSAAAQLREEMLANPSPGLLVGTLEQLAVAG
ncbi:hypothetical protein ACM01_01450 [Streptomyces viridochromogenes]|uniref:Uncharacterized protein n=1 Tax=Streptomyces viridochromogenes TaxID=1938 RepID=A0A0J7ZMR3_STRVR|nr:nucleotide disphospho-sugar-binding domain-containing protein [Streptomyces viridochromogenes]KMS77321.1 hypothetical protein ACM01_01450 [Streptomyces viridochromogenes]KOG19044.1 hypothetical protein ADK36_20580 [Streptomyces viridochromogenes]KOG19283.1 hypothetical protein ADK35_20440 [Streptomyces viridochromogenes]